MIVSCSSTFDSGERKFKKRKYVKKPKKDPSAPEKPKSAYIQFSSAIRKQLDQTLTFSEASKIVGAKWSSLGSKKLELEESAAKDMRSYKSQLRKYKETREYRDHQKYVTEFMIANGVTEDSKPEETFSSLPSPTPISQLHSSPSPSNSQISLINMHRLITTTITIYYDHNSHFFVDY